MSEHVVTSGNNRINFGAEGLDEILQNVRMIISTHEYSCPMQRSFAWSPSQLDGPINIVQAKTTAKIVEAINKYEPRAEVVKVTYDGDMSGGLKPVVRVKITDG